MTSKLPYWTPAQTEFLSEDEPVKIVPNFSLGKLELLTGNIGPFRPGIPLEVPVWLAVNLKKRGRCTIQAPDWLDVDYLKDVYDREHSRDEFQELPFYYMEIASQLLDVARDDIPNADQIYPMLEDVWSKREEKAKHGIHQFEPNMEGFRVNSLSSMEMNTLRPLYLQVLNKIFTLSSAAEVGTQFFLPFQTVERLQQEDE